MFHLEVSSGNSPAMAICHRRWLIFAITFISYASTHACRQSFASAKKMLKSRWSFNKHFEGTMDGVFLMTYALGLFSSGVIGDKFDAARFHAFGLLMTALIYLLFAVSVPVFKLNVDDHSAFFILLWIINGFIQSIGWPTGVKLIGNWFTYSNPSERRQSFIFKGYDGIGLIFGIWAAHQYIGNIIGIGYVNLVERHGWSTSLCFLLPAAQSFIVANLVLLFATTNPITFDLEERRSHLAEEILKGNDFSINGVSKQGLLSPNEEKVSGDNLHAEDQQQNVENDSSLEKEEYEYGVESDSDESVPSNEYRLSFRNVLRLRNVVRYGLFYACLKGVNYTIFFWFGYFGSSWDNLTTEESGNFLILFNIGSIVGGWICGFLTDRYKVLSKHGRSPIILGFLLVSIPAVVALYFKPRQYPWLYGIICFVAGFFVGGPSNLISTVMATDVGKLQEIKGNPASIATVSGIIDGTGSFGAAVSDYVSTFISDYKESYVYIFLAGQLLIGALVIWPVARRDLRGIMSKIRRKE